MACKAYSPAQPASITHLIELDFGWGVGWASRSRGVLAMQRTVSLFLYWCVIKILLCHVIFFGQSRNLRKIENIQKSTKSLMYHKRITLTDMGISVPRIGL